MSRDYEVYIKEGSKKNRRYRKRLRLSDRRLDAMWTQSIKPMFDSVFPDLGAYRCAATGDRGFIIFLSSAPHTASDVGLAKSILYHASIEYAKNSKNVFGRATPVISESVHYKRLPTGGHVLVGEVDIVFDAEYFEDKKSPSTKFNAMRHFVGEAGKHRWHIARECLLLHLNELGTSTSFEVTCRYIDKEQKGSYYFWPTNADKNYMPRIAKEHDALMGIMRELFGEVTSYVHDDYFQMSTGDDFIVRIYHAHDGYVEDTPRMHETPTPEKKKPSSFLNFDINIVRPNRERYWDTDIVPMLKGAEFEFCSIQHATHSDYHFGISFVKMKPLLNQLPRKRSPSDPDANDVIKAYLEGTVSPHIVETLKRYSATHPEFYKKYAQADGIFRISLLGGNRVDSHEGTDVKVIPYVAEEGDDTAYRKELYQQIVKDYQSPFEITIDFEGIDDEQDASKS